MTCTNTCIYLRCCVLICFLTKLLIFFCLFFFLSFFVWFLFLSLLDCLYSCKCRVKINSFNWMICANVILFLEINFEMIRSGFSTQQVKNSFSRISPQEISVLRVETRSILRAVLAFSRSEGCDFVRVFDVVTRAGEKIESRSVL